MRRAAVTVVTAVAVLTSVVVVVAPKWNAPSSGVVPTSSVDVSIDVVQGDRALSGPQQDCAAETPECVKDEIYARVRAGGPQAAIDYLDDLFERYPDQEVNCHGLYHIVGRATAYEYANWATFSNTDCLYGFLHGLLQSLGMEYTSTDAFLAEVAPYCQGFEQPTFSDCNHGLGHALAMVVPDDLPAAVEACGQLDWSMVGGCVGGVMMEFGEDLLFRSGLTDGGNSVSSDNGEILTDVADTDVVALCATVGPHGRSECYSRLWMFVTMRDGRPLPLGALYGAIERSCGSAPDAELRRSCQIGFGEMVLRLYYRESPDLQIWPPDTPEEADRFARAMVEMCDLHPHSGHCIIGFIRGTLSHLNVAGYREDTIPDPCAYVDARDADDCAEGQRQVRALRPSPSESVAVSS